MSLSFPTKFALSKEYLRCQRLTWNCAMKVGITTCMSWLFAVALTMGGPIRRQASRSEKTVPIGGNVTLLCPLFPDDLWIWVYWMKNDHTIYSLEVLSNTPWTNDTRYEGSNHATRLMIKDLKKTDSGIYHCKVATLVFIKERGQVLLSVTDQEVGLSTTSPGVPFRASTTIPPQPAVDYDIVLAISIVFLLLIIQCFIYRKRLKNLPSGFVRAFRRLAPRSTSTQLPPDSSNHEIRDEEGTFTSLLSSDTHDRDDEDVDNMPDESSNVSQSLNVHRYEEDFDQKERIGEGVFGKVYKVQHRLLNEHYAMKKIEVTKRKACALQREIQTLACLNHPNVVRYHQSWFGEEIQPVSQQPLPGLGSFDDMENGFEGEDDDDKEEEEEEEEEGEKLERINSFLYIQMELFSSTLRTCLNGRNDKISKAESK